MFELFNEIIWIEKEIDLRFVSLKLFISLLKFKMWLNNKNVLYVHWYYKYRITLRELACSTHWLWVSMGALKTEIIINFRIKFNGNNDASKPENQLLMQGQKLKKY